jgi:uncharacterized integral membrane protein
MDVGADTDHEHEPAKDEPAVSPTEPAPAGAAPPAAQPQAPAPTPPATPAPEAVTPHFHEPEGLRWTFWVMLAALLFFIGYSIAFIVGNDKTISVDFVFATGNVSLIWTILLLLLVGVLAGALFGHLYRRHGRKKVRKA